MLSGAFTGVHFSRSVSLLKTSSIYGLLYPILKILQDLSVLPYPTE